MPKFDGSPYTELTTPEDNDLLGVVKDVSEVDPANQTKFEKHSTFYNYLLAKLRANVLKNTIIEGLQLIRNSVNSLSVGVGSCYAENGDFIDVTSTLTASSLSLSTSTWYHVYLYLSSGVPTMEVVTTAPAAWKGNAYKKTSDTTRRYVGSIKTDSSGNILFFVHDLQRNFIRYARNNLITSPFRVLSGGTATTATAVDCSGIAPTTVISIFLRIVQNGNQLLYVGGDSSLSSTVFDNVLNAIVDDTKEVFFEIFPAVQSIYYLYGAVVTGSVNIDVSGYFFKR